MTVFGIFAYTVVVAVIGYMIGHDCGESEGYLIGKSESYKEVR